MRVRDGVRTQSAAVHGPMACSCKDAGPCKRLWVDGVGKWDAEGEVSSLANSPPAPRFSFARTMYLAPCGLPLAPSGRTPSLLDVVEMPSTSKAILPKARYSAPVPARRRKRDSQTASGFPTTLQLRMPCSTNLATGETSPSKAECAEFPGCSELRCFYTIQSPDSKL